MIVSGIASIPTRHKQLKKAVNSIIPHVDRLIVGLNNYPVIPPFLKLDKVQVFQFDNSLGDAVKFKGLDFARPGDIYMSFDDDLAYFPDYFKLMTQGARDHGIVTLHGRTIQKPFKSFIKSTHVISHCLQPCDSNYIVPIGGTGVMAFNTGVFDLSFEDFRYKNCADIQLAIAAKEQGLNITALKHRGNIVRYSLHKRADTIYGATMKNDNIPTKLIREHLL